MTNFERKQDKKFFIEAGKNAFQIGVHILDNPYKEQPYRSLWIKGYKTASKNYKA